MPALDAHNPPAIQAPALSASQARDNAALLAAVQAEGDTKAIRALEPGALQAAGKRVIRKGPALRMRLGMGFGGTLDYLLTDEPTCPPPPGKTDTTCVAYSLVAHAGSRGVFVVAASYFEGGAWLVIDDKSGSLTKVDAPPQFGTDDKHFLTIDNDDASGDGAITVWERRGGGFRQVWRGQHGHNHAYVEDWSRPDEVRLRLEPLPGQPPLTQAGARLVHAKTWSLAPPQP